MIINSELLNTLSEEYGDAYYLLDSEQFKKNCIALVNSFQSIYSKFGFAYSYKTNYIPALVQIVNELGGFAEIVSEMELDIALKSGVYPEKIIWNGPIKNALRVKELLLLGGIVNIDSIFEVGIILAIAKEYPDKNLKVGIRCNFDVGDGVISRFGFDTEGKDFEEAIKRLTLRSNINIVGFQAHFAKRSPDFWTERAKGMINLYDRLSSEHNLKLMYLDLGGGIYGNMPDDLRAQLNIGRISFDDYSSKAATVFKERFSSATDAPYLLIEPGTALAGDSMKFVSRVETFKTVRNKYIATAMGSQKNIGMQGLNPPLEVFPCGNVQQQYENLDIAGYTCIESDYLYKGFNGKLAQGDYLVFSNCGSYSVVMKPPFILPNFPIIDICGNKVQLIKRAETFDDLFQTYFF